MQIKFNKTRDTKREAKKSNNGWKKNKRLDNYRFGCTLWRTAFHDGDVAERNSCVLWFQTEFIAQHWKNGERAKMTINSDAVLIINANVLSGKVSRHILVHAIFRPHDKSQNANGQGRLRSPSLEYKYRDGFLDRTFSSGL